ncbi:MAG: [LSU ribosomal protein L3P]-glutamine N5-methyltransferase [Candidatus Kentron sp. G]|nr:MAG: [LSU ribosomal protein L3P]-glutamine N5-methyltransferase [Candidatus Kentron sp. G]VFN05320.1 MAG: [LSU ribosomal protein L3P]-glutamine N5-methyltransferase [Candidatus Kentron sp. G]VFN05445.1 MAG: [LSU ribosomal protein L3P]-glutamine N5-methyltransferase [Candidatus Kentron sp. G]
MQDPTGWDLVRWGASRFNAAGIFFGHGTDNAMDEALVLVRHALHLPPDIPGELLGGRLVEEERNAVLTLFSRRVEERIPAAYLTREAWFMGLEFYVDERVLIPRSPMAEWIERGFAPWLDPEGAPAGSGRAPGRILDLGTGSGCLAIALASVFPETRIDAVDISADALEVAHHNIRAHGLEDRVHAIESDLFAGLDTGLAVSGPYDLIVSNPPYVDARELAAMPSEYHHEPLIGLSGGDDGLAIVGAILREAGRFLAPEGILAVEVGSSRPAVEKAFPKLPLIWLTLTSGGENVFLIPARELSSRSPPDLGNRSEASPRTGKA